MLNGAQEIPVPTESPSQGVALVVLVKETKKVCYRLSYSPSGVALVSRIEYSWEVPGYSDFLRRLASFCRLILVDRRGTGLSDPGAALPTPEERAILATVHIGARVVAAADPGEVLVSSTVKDLVVGLGIAFTSRGAHDLAGVPGEWRLFRVERTA